MEIKTKFNYDDTVFYEKNNSFHKMRVVGIDIHIYSTNTTIISYSAYSEEKIPEADCASTLEELRDLLKQKIDEIGVVQ